METLVSTLEKLLFFQKTFLTIFYFNNSGIKRKKKKLQFCLAMNNYDNEKELMTDTILFVNFLMEFKYIFNNEH